MEDLQRIPAPVWYQALGGLQKIHAPVWCQALGGLQKIPAPVWCQALGGLLKIPAPVWCQALGGLQRIPVPVPDFQVCSRHGTYNVQPAHHRHAEDRGNRAVVSKSWSEVAYLLTRSVSSDLHVKHMIVYYSNAMHKSMYKMRMDGGGTINIAVSEHLHRVILWQSLLVINTLYT